MKSLTKTDRIFIAALAVGFLMHLFFLFAPPTLFDESFYAAIPFRLTQGDSLVKDEWHLAQFSSLFSYLPVRFWSMLVGSADGLILFLRSLYLAVHTAASVLIYVVFRKKAQPAMLAAFMFYLQTPYRIYSISYVSMFSLFLLFFSISLLLIYRKGAKKYYFAAGVSYGACCVSNPVFCTFPVLYLLLYILWLKRNSLRNLVMQYRRTQEKRKSAVKRRKITYKKAPQPFFDFLENCSCFFKGKTFLYTAAGVAAIAVIGMFFFFATGGTMASLAQNLKYLLGSSEYSLASLSLREKYLNLRTAVNSVSLHMPFLLPLLFFALLVDKKRKNNLHRAVYLCITILLSFIYIAGMVSAMYFTAFFFSLPFLLLSLVCYILTDQKNHALFVCFWCPCAAAAIVNMCAANTLLSSMSVAFAVGNTAGVLFAWDLFNELRVSPQKTESAVKKGEGGPQFSRFVICFGLVLQLTFYVFVLQYGQLPSKETVQVREGPYTGMCFPREKYEAYEASLRDLDEIKARSRKEDPVLIVSYQSWMYLYTQRPMATYTVWFRGAVQQDDLLAYYRVNPEKIPKYIYVVNRDYDAFTGIDSYNVKENIGFFQKYFTFTEEELTEGVLLCVNGHDFDQKE